MAEKKETNDTKSEIKLKGDSKKVMELVEKMTVLELSELVKALEEKFGVSASAPMMVAGTASSGETEEKAATEKSNYDVVIKSPGEKKIAVIKAVRSLDSSLGLVEAKELVEQTDAVVLKGAKKEDAQEAKKALEEAGATIELV